MRKFFKFSLILLTACLSCDVVHADEEARPPEKIPANKLLEDVNLLRRLYECAHPGLYRYNTKVQMEEHYDELCSQFDRDRSLGEAYVAFSQFLAKLKCGHSYANFFNQSKEVRSALFVGKNRVPFTFRWIGGRMIVTRNLSDSPRLKPGTEILSISGIPTNLILERLMTIARADGSNNAKRVSYLEVRGNSKYEAFDIFLPLFFPTIRERIELLVHEPGAAEQASVTVEAHDQAMREAIAQPRKEPRLGDSTAPWSFQMLDDRTAYLRMPGWALYKSKWDWKSFLDKGIDDLIDRRVPAFIVDIRDNEGGLDVGNALIERIATRDVRSQNQQRFTRYRKLPKEFEPFLSTWDNSFKNWGEAAKEDRNGFFRLTRFDDDAQGDAIRPRGRRYEGRVVVLISAVNSSATFQFARLIKEQKLAKLIGQTTGGNLRGINGGAFFFATLPNSRIEVDLPLIASFPDGEPRPDGQRIPFEATPDAGVEPDIKVAPSIEDIARGVDTELEAAKALLGARISRQSPRVPG